MKRALIEILRLALLIVLSALALQIFLALRITAMRWIDPQSTTFQRSEALRILQARHHLLWSQEWVELAGISPTLQRAVIASEDAGFADHGGIEWDALEKAWQKNQRAIARSQQSSNQTANRPQAAASAAPAAQARRREPKLVGGSTITQQLAKNLFLSGERNLARKGQEFLITLMLEQCLDKRRILEIYLNSVEWGEGLFGAQAAAQHYFLLDAARLDSFQAARLTVMLPAPKRFEKNPSSAYVIGRAATIAARMPAVELP